MRELVVVVAHVVARVVVVAGGRSESCVGVAGRGHVGRRVVVVVIVLRTVRVGAGVVVGVGVVAHSVAVVVCPLGGVVLELVVGVLVSVAVAVVVGVVPDPVAVHVGRLVGVVVVRVDGIFHAVAVAVGGERAALLLVCVVDAVSVVVVVDAVAQPVPVSVQRGVGRVHRVGPAGRLVGVRESVSVVVVVQVCAVAAFRGNYLPRDLQVVDRCRSAAVAVGVLQRQGVGPSVGEHVGVHTVAAVVAAVVVPQVHGGPVRELQDGDSLATPVVRGQPDVQPDRGSEGADCILVAVAVAVIVVPHDRAVG